MEELSSDEACPKTLRYSLLAGAQRNSPNWFSARWLLPEVQSRGSRRIEPQTGVSDDGVLRPRRTSLAQTLVGLVEPVVARGIENVEVDGQPSEVEPASTR